MENDIPAYVPPAHVKLNDRWNDERLAALRKHWGEGWSGDECAGLLNKEFGTSYTRNAIIGKANRDGMVRRDRLKSIKTVSKRKRKVKESVATFKRRVAALADVPVVALNDFDSMIPAAQRKTLLDLTEETCKWPVGDPRSPDFFFCGGHSLSEGPYCAYHSRVAYQPVRARKEAQKPFQRAA